MAKSRGVRWAVCSARRLIDCVASGPLLAMRSARFSAAESKCAWGSRSLIKPMCKASRALNGSPVRAIFMAWAAGTARSNS
ncbi:hypothetical protein D3C84_1198800 [compost metagenome]